MKILITYASAGAGHRKAAEAVYDYLKANGADLELKLVDILDYSSPLFKFFYSRGYIFTISYLPYLWYFLYLLSKIFPNNFFRVRQDYLNCQKFVALLKNERPDVIISTHFLTSGIVTIFKNNLSFPKSSIGNPVLPKLITIITDYNLHPFWINSGVDIYVASCSYVKDELLKHKVTADKIKVYGIPANQKFYTACGRKQAAERLGLNLDLFTVLIMTGAIGIGPIEEIVKVLAGDIQILVICGNNEKLYQRLKAYSRQQDCHCEAKPKQSRFSVIHPYQLVENIDELMSVSDIILTKAGGLTITESLCKSKPMIFFASIPGLETANAQVIADSGAGFKVEGLAKIKETVELLKNNRDIYEKTIGAVNSLRKADTLKNISAEIYAG